MRLHENAVYYVNFDKAMMKEVETKIKEGKKLNIAYYGDIKLWAVREV